MKLLNKLLGGLVHYVFFEGIIHSLSFFNNRWLKTELGFCGNNVYLGKPHICHYPNKIFLYDNTTVNPGATFILSPFCTEETGRFIMKKNSTAAQNLTVINHNHTTHPIIGKPYKEQSVNHEGDVVRDIVIEEDAFIGANVTICAGVTVGRGAIVGAGSVLRKSVPPYMLAYGNPAVVKRFVFSKKQILEHERQLYSEENRLTPHDLDVIFNSVDLDCDLS